MRALYTILFYLALPFIFGRLLWRSRANPEYRKRLGERLGFDTPKLKNAIWVHAVSMGETIAATPFIKAIKEKYPQYPILVTNMTLTGSARAKVAFGDQVFHAYIPYDAPDAVRRFLNRINPKICIIMETELWPNLFNVCKKRKIPIMVANARLSEKSAKGYKKISSLTKSMLSAVNKLASQGFADADRFIELGIAKENVKVTGNMKFDLELSPDLLEKSKNFRETLGENRPIWIAASTHPGEEEIILQAHREILKKFPNVLLILVPRHPERFNDIAKLIASKEFSLARRSLKEKCTAETQIYLGDTMGEMMLFYASSDIAFVGGSFVPIGGHNVLEPALLSKPVVTGPFLFNFAEISEMLLAGNGMIKIENSINLGAVISKLVFDSSYRKQIGDNAKGIVENNRGALKKQLELVDELLEAVTHY